MLAPAITRLRGRYHVDDILSRLGDERMQLWVFEVDGAVRTACVTQVIVYPRCKALQVFLVAGDGFDFWPQWMAVLREWARDIGCRFIEGSGRDGWARSMKSAGLHKTGSRYCMEITDA